MTLLRLLVIAGGLGYIIYTVQWADDPANDRPGMLTLLRSADLRWLFGGLGLAGVVFPLQGLRWYLLLRCRDLNVSFRSVMRLTMVGLFFNFCVPVGSNGGDVVKAYGAARGLKGTGSAAKAVVSVALDRVAGLLGLIVLAAVMGPLMWSDPIGRKIAIIAWAALGAVLVGGFVYLTPFTRKFLGIDLLTRLSLVQKVDAAVTGYRHHGVALLIAVALSVPVHVALSIATAMSGYAIGVTTPLVVLVTALPIVFIVGALPLTFMGLGVMEPTAIALLTTGDDAGATINQVVAMLMAWRAFLLAYAVIGGLLMLGKGMHLTHRPPTIDPDA
jgi:uncharacterized protein (TIRG00374 family)